MGKKIRVVSETDPTDIQELERIGSDTNVKETTDFGSKKGRDYVSGRTIYKWKNKNGKLFYSGDEEGRTIKGYQRI